MAAPALLRLLRWPGIVTAAADAATVGLLHAPCSDARTWSVAAAAASAYAGGVVLNDVVDRERDRALHPARPIPSGAASPRAAAALAAALLAASPLIALAAGPGAALGYGGVVAAVLAYDLVLKRFGPAGAVGMGLCRGGSAFAAALAFPAYADVLAADPARALLLPLPWFLHAALVTWASLQEDRPDGARRLAPAAAVVVVAPALTLPLLGLPPHPRVAWMLAIALLVVAVGTAAAAARRRGDAASVGLVVREGVFGFLLLDAAVLGARLPWPFGLAACGAWAVVRFALARRRS